MKTVQMPKWVVACLTISMLASLSLAVSALTSYTIVKPYTVTLNVASSQLTVQTLSFNYDPTQNQYTQCSLQIVNSAGQPASATIYVYLRNNTQHTIAQGQATQSFAPGATSITVPLLWLQNENVDNIAGGYVLVQPN